MCASTCVHTRVGTQNPLGLGGAPGSGGSWSRCLRPVLPGESTELLSDLWAFRDGEGTPFPCLGDDLVLLPCLEESGSQVGVPRRLPLTWGKPEPPVPDGGACLGRLAPHRPRSQWQPLRFLSPGLLRPATAGSDGRLHIFPSCKTQPPASSGPECPGSGLGHTRPPVAVARDVLCLARLGICLLLRAEGRPRHRCPPCTPCPGLAWRGLRAPLSVPNGAAPALFSV